MRPGLSAGSARCRSMCARTSASLAARTLGRARCCASAGADGDGQERREAVGRGRRVGGVGGGGGGARIRGDELTQPHAARQHRSADRIRVQQPRVENVMRQLEGDVQERPVESHLERTRGVHQGQIPGLEPHRLLPLTERAGSGHLEIGRGLHRSRRASHRSTRSHTRSSARGWPSSAARRTLRLPSAGRAASARSPLGLYPPRRCAC